MAELSYTSASQLTAAIKAKKLSPREAWSFLLTAPKTKSQPQMPSGMQIVTRRYADLNVIAANAVFERLRPWLHTYENCKSRAL